jgi:transcriptional regulator with GAF, ATPase, and Fis domain
MDPLQATTTIGGSSPLPYGARSLDDTLTEVMASVTRSIDLLEHAGVLVGRAPGFLSTASSDQLTSEVHGLHAVLGEGPCLDAMTTGLAVVTDSLAGEHRWPRWTAAAMEAGVRANVALPLVWEGRTLGALGLYWESPQLLDTATLNVAETCGLTASALVGWARSAQELQHALGTRQMIGQAVGVLMQRYGLTSEAAFSFLRRNSQNANTKLRDVAARFLETGELPQPPRTEGHRRSAQADPHTP